MEDPPRVASPHAGRGQRWGRPRDPFVRSLLLGLCCGRLLRRPSIIGIPMSCRTNASDGHVQARLSDSLCINVELALPSQEPYARPRRWLGHCFPRVLAAGLTVYPLRLGAMCLVHDLRTAAAAVSAKRCSETSAVVISFFVVHAIFAIEKIGCCPHDGEDRLTA